MERILYHFQMSPFSRRVRLALAHKGLDDVELRDGRADERFIVEARGFTPIKTMPVFVDEGRVVADSGAITHYLDLISPDRPLWPRELVAAQEAFAITTAVDVALNALVDMGTRDWPLRNDPAWSTVLGDRMARAQDAIDSVATKATRTYLAGDSWSVADIWTLSATRWVMAMPARAPTTPNIAQILTLGFRLPDALVAWAKQHEGRPEVKALYG